jgi:AcrR family transcriptional regulator
MASDALNLPVDRPVSRGEARRRAFLEAASEVFLEQGYEAASVNEVVRRAGGSLATLYQQFGNKDGLFLAVIEDGTARFVAPMVQAADADRPIEEGLQELGQTFLRQVLEPKAIAFFRMVVGEGRKFPGAISKFLSLGPDRLRKTVADYLLARAGPDGCVFGNPERAANYFCEMVRGRHQYRALADGDYCLSDARIVEEVSEAVRFFLRAARTR